MSHRVVIKPFAEADMKEIFAWYNKKKEGLGEIFLNEVERTIELIEWQPEQYQIRYKNVRMAKVNRFPVCLHYTIGEDTVYIHAVLSTSKDPKIWKML